MTPQKIPQTVLFPDLFDKPLVATFDRQHASSDGGAVLLKAAEQVYGLVAGFARCLVDRRELGKIRHTLTRSDSGPLQKQQLVVVEVVECRLKRQGHVDLQERLPDSIWFLNEPNVHGVYALLGPLELRAEDRILGQLVS